MTPPVPRGSVPESTTIPSETGTELAAPSLVSEDTSSPESTTAYLPWRFALDASYLLDGSAGQPFRVGLMGRFRPLREFAFGARLETNFSDEVSAALRLDGIIPFSREFSIYAAVEAGVRGLISQDHLMEDVQQRLNGALFQFAVEAGVDIQVHPNVDLGVFARLAYAPGGAVSAESAEPNPPAGVSFAGHELTIGIRVGFDVGDPVAAQPVPAEPVASPQLEQATTAISGIEEIVTAIEDRAETTILDSADAPSAEDLETLRSELRGLRGSAEALQTQIAAADRVFRSLQRGQEVGAEYRMRLDRIYDGLDHRPPQIDVASVETYLSELETALRDNGDFRLLVQSSTEAFGMGFLGNIRTVRSTLLEFQSRLPLTARRTGDLTRAALDPLVPRLNAIIAVLEDLRRRPVDTEPSTDRIALWREGLASLETQIASLSPRLEAEQQEQLNAEFTRLNESFSHLVEDLEASERLWMIARSTFGHYQALQDARRPDQAGAALSALLSELRSAPEAFRGSHRRGLENLRIAVVAFIDRHRTHSRWRAARDLAVEVAQWIDPAYVAPAAPERGETTARTPREPRGADRPRTGGTERPRFRVPEDSPETED